MAYEWDAVKAAANSIKHGVTFEEAATVFDDPYALTVPDSGHSTDEERCVTLGMSSQLRILLVVTTERSDNLRIISARKATASERKLYERFP